MNCNIRSAAHADAAGIIRAHRRSIRELCGADYTAEQIAVWSGRDFSRQFWCDTMDVDAVEVVVDSAQQVRGFCHHGRPSEDSSCYEVMSLYLCPEVMGCGLGRRLMINATRQAKRHQCREIRLNSTMTARAFYTHLGFQIVAETAKEMQDVKIPCIAMSLPLIESSSLNQPDQKPEKHDRG
jgi:GNAT superfamily N-acetyltransferase